LADAHATVPSYFTPSVKQIFPAIHMRPRGATILRPAAHMDRIGNHRLMIPGCLPPDMASIAQVTEETGQ
jgi:hypothetical protein